MRNPDEDGRFARHFVPPQSGNGIDLSNVNIRIRGMSEQPRVEIRVRENIEESKQSDHR